MKEHYLLMDLIQKSTWTNSRIRNTDTVNFNNQPNLQTSSLQFSYF